MPPHELSFQQLLRRLLIAMLLSGFLTSIVSFWIFHSANEQAAERQRLNALNHYTAAISSLEREWGSEAYNFRIHLESSRFLEDAEPRKERLLSLLAAQGGSLEFAALYVEDAGGELVTSYEYGGHKIPKIRFKSGQETSWAFDAEQGRLYMAFRQPVWLGKGNGRLVVLKPMDNALLTQYDYPNIRLSLWWNDRPIAASGGSIGLAAASLEFAKSGASDSSIRLPWTGVDADEAPILFIESTSPPLMTVSEILLPVIIVLITFAFAVGAILGNRGLVALKNLLLNIQTKNEES